MGYEMMQFDMEVAREISERITEQHNTANGKSNANNAVARRNQKRHQRDKETISNKKMGGILDDWLKDGD
tara:strand:+ start:824 stop:1033 length:210 start_codon:yes stop_codon:yes gene_type:complete